MALDNKSHLAFEVKDDKVSFYVLRVDIDQIEKVIKEAAIKFGEIRKTKTKKTIDSKKEKFYESRKKGTITEDGVLINEEIDRVDLIDYNSKGTKDGDIKGVLVMINLDLTIASFPPFTKELLEYLKDTSNFYHLNSAIAELKKDENKEVQGFALAIKDAVHREELVECSYNDYPQTLYELSLNPDPTIAYQALDLLRRCVSPEKEIEVDSGEFVKGGKKKVKVGDHLKTRK